MGLLFVLLLMYQMVSDEDAANAPAPVDEAAQQQTILPDPPPANSKPAEPPQPEKPPPLNDR